MDRARALAALGEHQSTIAALLRQSRERLDLDQAANAASLAALRWQLMRALRAYQLFKHRVIFDPAAKSGNAAEALRAAAMKERCLAIGEVFTEHVKRWSDGRAIAAWPDYVAAASTLVDQIADHLERESAEVRALPLGADRTRR